MSLTSSDSLTGTPGVESDELKTQVHVVICRLVSNIVNPHWYTWSGIRRVKDTNTSGHLWTFSNVVIPLTGTPVSGIRQFYYTGPQMVMCVLVSLTLSDSTHRCTSEWNLNELTTQVHVVICGLVSNIVNPHWYTWSGIRRVKDTSTCGHLWTC